MSDLIDSLYARIDQLEAERNELARQLGEEVARTQDWMLKCQMAHKRADRSDALFRAADQELNALKVKYEQLLLKIQ